MCVCVRACVCVCVCVCVQEDMELRQAFATYEEAFDLGVAGGASRKHLAQLLTNMAAVKRLVGADDAAAELTARAQALLRPAASAASVAATTAAVTVEAPTQTETAPSEPPAPVVTAEPATLVPAVTENERAPAVTPSVQAPACDPVAVDDMITEMLVSCVCVCVCVVLMWIIAIFERSMCVRCHCVCVYIVLYCIVLYCIGPPREPSFWKRPSLASLFTGKRPAVCQRAGTGGFLRGVCVCMCVCVCVCVHVQENKAAVASWLDRVLFKKGDVIPMLHSAHSVSGVTPLIAAAGHAE
ncbi:MAG: hypothetical protein P4L40_04145 [Terracidiphilus sp.]|nr:hypothetical protein [Terracidiphilus sp.]